ncbi:MULTISPECIES: hypothetical protein [Pasteurellaceae]|uniref:hypothetical protein n=1 Tax=Pasteurellaceae TaxID=712 RepID=UPI003567D4D8
MKKLAFFLTLGLTGCAIFGPTYSGETTADWLLKIDTEKNINLYFDAIYHCRPSTIHTQIDEVALNADKTAVLGTKETWTASGCGHTKAFPIQYINDGNGGTYIQMSIKP